MTYMGDQQFWDKKFESRGQKVLSADEELIKNTHYLKAGSVLDVACGDGRNSLYLLKQGFEVTGIDFSEQALNRLNHFADQLAYTIMTKQVDLSQDNALNNLDKYDNILINHYRLPKIHMDNIKKHLKKKGLLFVTGFGHKHQVNDKIRVNDLIQASDFDCISNEMTLIHKNEYTDSRGFFVTYIFRYE